MNTPTPSRCGHQLACTYGRVDHERQLCQVWWCHECGALAIRRVQGGRPNRGEWWHVIGKRGPAAGQRSDSAGSG